MFWLVGRIETDIRREFWMISLRMGSSSFNQQSNHGTMGEIEEADDVGHDSISSSSEVSSVPSSESDLMDEATSSASSSPPSSTSDSATSGQLAADPLLDMSSLMQQLPFKRGLSMYFQGKSQSFTSLSNVRCLEDLAKPENPYNKKLKSCKSYGVLSGSNRSSRFISKKASSRGSCSSLSAKRTASFLGNYRPSIPPPPPSPPHPHGSTGASSISNQTPLFA